MPRALRRLTLQRDGYRCTVCGATEQLEVHHVVPRRAGGADALSNLVTLCVACHEKEHAGAEVTVDRAGEGSGDEGDSA
jgi:5-methylcytosine-specific restriction endonuclease McrA